MSGSCVASNVSCSKQQHLLTEPGNLAVPSRKGLSLRIHSFGTGIVVVLCVRHPEKADFSVQSPGSGKSLNLMASTERSDLSSPGPTNPGGTYPSSNAAARTPSSVRPPKPRFAGPVYRLLPAVLVLVVATAFSAKRMLPNSTLEVQQIPAGKLTEPAPLEGVLAANNRLFSSTVQKIFEGVNGSGKGLRPTADLYLLARH